MRLTVPRSEIRTVMMPALTEVRRTLAEQGNRVVFFAPTSGEVERLADILREYQIPFQLGLDSTEGTPEYLVERSYIAGPGVRTYVVKGNVPRGVSLPEAAIAVIGAEDLFDTSDLVARPGGASKSAAGAFKFDIADLKPGDYIVHTVHGVGKFLGVRELGQGDQKGDFMLIEYAADAKLYVPLTRLDLIEKYRGAGEQRPPALDRMGGATWTKTKSRVKAKMRDMADELLKLYAQRKMAAIDGGVKSLPRMSPRPPYPPHTAANSRASRSRDSSYTSPSAATSCRARTEFTTVINRKQGTYLVYCKNVHDDSNNWKPGQNCFPQGPNKGFCAKD